MAIVQISRITHRKGLLEDLPQLAGAELGYAVNERRLFIGNGTLQEGAPVVGNTEILTEFSNLFELQNSYTYRGESAGYIVQTGPAAGSPVTQSLQSRLDDFATVTDFGAVGDGITDNTEAINRALFELYCRSNNTAARRGLFFPAGVYLIKETIIIPPYAYLYGEGAQSSIITLDVASDVSTLNAYVARTGDSLQQTGAQIGNNGATPPTSISIVRMGFESYQNTDVFLVDCATDVAFTGCAFIGPVSRNMIATGFEGSISGVTFNSTGSLITNDVSFQQCFFTQTTWAVTASDVIQGIVFNDCHFDTLYEGILLTAIGASIPEGVRIIGCSFDNIFKRGIIFDNSEQCASAFNTFYDVGTRFSGTPTDPIIYLNAATNVSCNDLFDRSEAEVQATGIPRIQTLDAPVVVIDNGYSLDLGNYQMNAAEVVTLPDNASTTTLFTTNASISQSLSQKFKAFKMTYTFIRGTTYRSGEMMVVSNPSLFYDDEFIENAALGTGLTLAATQAGDSVSVTYATTSTGTAGTLTYSISHLA